MTSAVRTLPRRVYLSGGMEYAANEGRDWRLTLQEWLEGELGWSVFNPNQESERFFAARYPGLNFRSVKESDIEKFREIVAQLVDIDSHEIAERSDLVICYWDEGAARGAGTKGELTMARFFHKPVFMVTAIPQHQIPGWVLGCVSVVFSSFDQLREYIESTMVH